MEKNWLIRTKSNHILGPISREKVLELYNNGSIKQDDEICTGNGFWFFIREEDMVERYLLGQEPQGFNPISEAKDVLTSNSREARQDKTLDDITTIKQLSSYNSESASLSEAKKKLKNNTRSNESRVPRVKPSFTKHPYLVYLGYLGFVILLLLVYYRKKIIRNLWVTEFSLIAPAFAQDVGSPPKKKSLLDSSVTLDKVSFSPLMNLDGMRVVSSLDVAALTCQELQLEPIQLAVILYPAESFNEKFLIKLRDCVTKLSEDHPLKRWMKELGKMPTPSPDEQKKTQFLLDVINSRFNLITDLSTKNQIVSILNQLPDLTLNEKILRSFLYLMIGNVTKSDNILRDIIRQKPFTSWSGYSIDQSFYHRLVKANLPSIWERLVKHPSDRKTFGLFNQYLLHYMNDEQLITVVKEQDKEKIIQKLELQNTERVAPILVKSLRLHELDEAKRMAYLRGSDMSIEDQIYWVWPFIDVAPLVSDLLLAPIENLEKQNELWFIYLMENEKLSDLYANKFHKSPLLGRRLHLRANLKEKKLFMLTLYQLISLGDVDASIIQETLRFLTHE